MRVFTSLVMKALSWLSFNHHGQVDNLQTMLPQTILGGANFTYCPESRSTDLYQIDEIEANPHWPPLLSSQGEEILLPTYGTFLKDISENATWFYDISLKGWPEHFNGTTDFCVASPYIEQPDPALNRSCPPEKGFAFITYYLPILGGSYAPNKGTWKIHIDAKTKEGERIYCVENSAYLDWAEGEDPGYNK